MTPRERMESDGYYLARDVLSLDEIAVLREALDRHFRAGTVVERLGQYQGGLPAAVPSISWLFHHPAILAIFRDLLGTDNLVFSGNAHANRDLVSKWHRDTHEARGGCFEGDYFARPGCRVYRAGIYLQDHSQDLLGLNIRRGSHRVRDADGLPAEAIPTRLGDIIFFDYRSLHAGILPDPLERLMVSAGRQMGHPDWIVALKQRYWRLTGKPDKLGIFFAFGTPEPDTEDFCRFELGIRRERLGTEGFQLPDQLLSAMEQAGVLTYEAALKRRFGPDIIDRFAVDGTLPEERLWS